MNKILKPLIGCVITLSLTIGLVQYTGHILDPEWTEDGFDVIEAFDLLEDDSLDVIVYGSSHAWKGCDTRVMCNDYGLNAYNYSCNWQSINTILLFLKDSLRTQHPKVACIEAGTVNNIEQDVDLNGQIYYTRPMANFDGKKQYLRQCFGNDIERYVSYYVPLVMFHDNWNLVNFENYRFPGPQRFIDSRGYLASSRAVPFEDPGYESFQQEEIQEDCIAVLDEIVSICNESDIQLLFYTSPWAGEYCYGDAMEKYAADKDCDYINMFQHTEDMGFDWSRDLQDAGHLNTSGSAKLAAYLSEYIIDHYDVPRR